MPKYPIPIIVFVVSLILFSFQSGVIGLEFKGDENFYYQSARQMVDTDDWVTPHYFNEPRFQKPPLYYWITAFLFKAFGEGWKIARFPAAVSMALVMVFIYLFGIRLFNRRIALLSSLIAVSSIATFRYARLVLPEALLTLFLCATLYLFLVKKAYLLAYVLIGLSVLIKGPVALILPLFIIGAYRCAKGEKGIFKDIRFSLLIFTALAISLPWFIMMIRMHGQPYLNHIIFRETIQRIGGLKYVLKALLYFLPVIFLYYLPWSLFSLQAINHTSHLIAKKPSYRDGAVFSFVWFFSIMVFFTFIGEKHRHYMLLACAPFALMAGNYFDNLFTAKKNRKAILLFALLFAGFFLLEAGKIVITREIGGMSAIFHGKNYNIERSDTVGIGSSGIVHQQLEVFTNHPVERFWYKWPAHMQKECDRENKIALNNTLFGSITNAFLLIEKEDFDKHILPKTKNRLTFLGKSYMYNKGLDFKGALKALIRLDIKGFLDLFKKEIYFVTNKKDPYK